MMKMNFSPMLGASKIFLSSAFLIIAFLFSGVSLSAQQFTSELPSDKELMSAYGDNFVDKTAAFTLSKQSINLLFNTPAANPQEEASRSVELTFVESFTKGLDEDLEVSASLNQAYAAAISRTEDFIVSVDVTTIYTKYYDLFTN